MQMTPLGNIFIVAAPSGGGKTSLVGEIVQNADNIFISISHTTRPIRPGEKDGENYYFLNHESFLEKITAGDFIEHAQVFNHYYGTSKQEIESRTNSGSDVILDIDWQGAKQIKEIFPQAISIFVLPPSVSELEKRLRSRKQDKESVIGTRMAAACSEMSHYAEFDYLVVNDSFAQASLDIQAIVTAARLRVANQQIKHQKLLSLLLASG